MPYLYIVICIYIIIILVADWLKWIEIEWHWNTRSVPFGRCARLDASWSWSLMAMWIRAPLIWRKPWKARRKLWSSVTRRHGTPWDGKSTSSGGSNMIEATGPTGCSRSSLPGLVIWRFAIEHGPVIVDFMVIFYSYVSLPEGTCCYHSHWPTPRWESSPCTLWVPWWFRMLPVPVFHSYPEQWVVELGI